MVGLSVKSSVVCPAMVCALRFARRYFPIVLGRYSPSQNGIVVSPFGIALCLAGGGKGHDTDKPKILIEYEF